GEARRLLRGCSAEEGGGIMLKMTSRVRHGLWLCALGALALGTGCAPLGDDASSGSADSGGSTEVTGGTGTGGADTGGDSDAGALPWSELVTNAYPYGVAADPWGNIVIAGTFHDTMDFGEGHKLVSKGGLDAFVVKLDPSGNPLWIRGFGGHGDQRVR